ncbi:hypothetical protein CJ307_35865, partial [Klebsiella quasipneumoniae]
LASGLAGAPGEAQTQLWQARGRRSDWRRSTLLQTLASGLAGAPGEAQTQLWQARGRRSDWRRSTLLQ